MGRARDGGGGGGRRVYSEMFWIQNVCRYDFIASCVRFWFRFLDNFVGNISDI